MATESDHRSEGEDQEFFQGGDKEGDVDYGQQHHSGDEGSYKTSREESRSHKRRSGSDGMSKDVDESGILRQEISTEEENVQASRREDKSLVGRKDGRQPQRPKTADIEAKRNAPDDGKNHSKYNASDSEVVGEKPARARPNHGKEGDGRGFKNVEGKGNKQRGKEGNKHNSQYDDGAAHRLSDVDRRELESGTRTLVHDKSFSKSKHQDITPQSPRGSQRMKVDFHGDENSRASGSGGPLKDDTHQQKRNLMEPNKDLRGKRSVAKNETRGDVASSTQGEEKREPFVGINDSPNLGRETRFERGWVESSEGNGSYYDPGVLHHRFREKQDLDRGYFMDARDERRWRHRSLNDSSDYDTRLHRERRRTSRSVSRHSRRSRHASRSRRSSRHRHQHSPYRRHSPRHPQRSAAHDYRAPSRGRSRRYPDSPSTCSTVSDYEDRRPRRRYSRPRSSRDSRRRSRRAQRIRKYSSDGYHYDEDQLKPEPGGSKGCQRKASLRVVIQKTDEDAGSSPKRPEPEQRTKASAKERDFSDDISEWGKNEKPDFYDSDKTPSTQTMTSGLSPREQKPATMDWDPDIAQRTLAYNAGLYGASQTMRRQGQIGNGAATLSDDLPSRLAYQHLNALAGMAGKVQNAILHNKKIFEHRLLMAEQALKQRGFDAWKDRVKTKRNRIQIIQRVVSRIQRGMLARAFFKWREEFHLVDKNLRMIRKATTTTQRGLLSRCLKEWQAVCTEHAWKHQVKMREREIKALESKVRGYERRPIVVLKYRKMKDCFQAWLLESAMAIEKRRRREKAVQYFINSQYSKAWNSWCAVAGEERRKRILMKKCACRIRRACLACAMSSWQAVVGMKEEKQHSLARGLAQWQKSTLSKAWKTLVTNAQWRKDIRQICSRWKQPFLAKALAGWVNRVRWKKRMQVIVASCSKRLLFRAEAMAFQAWTEAVDDAQVQGLIESKEEVIKRAQEVGLENDRLRRDNERFVRLIDSGEWGRGRVDELCQAGEILKSERDALMELVRSLRREYEAVERAKLSQDSELRDLKEKLVLGGAATAAGRNKMLVRGASSFNALVRAMKQDLVEKGGGKEDPGLLYEVEKMSLDKVHVFPDGELKVEAVAAGGNSGSPPNSTRTKGWEPRSRRQGVKDGFQSKATSVHSRQRA